MVTIFECILIVLMAAKVLDISAIGLFIVLGLCLFVNLLISK
jgi:hypothetical protein